MLATAAWFGAVTGLVELGIVLARVGLFQRVSFDLLSKNHHLLWMIPASHLTMFLAAGVLVCGLRLARPAWAFPAALWVFTFLASLALLLLIPGLFLAADVLLAAGVSCRLARCLFPHGRRLLTVVRFTLPGLALAGAALFACDFVTVTRRESRALAALPHPITRAPNVLLVVLDTVRADHLTMYGYARDTTPHLARFAERGVRFDRAHTPAPWTLPAHASLLTGRWPHELSVRAGRVLDNTYPTLAGFLSAHGYACAGFVANTLNTNAWYGLDRGFARYEDHYRNTEVSLGEMFLCSALGRRLGGQARSQSVVPWADEVEERVANRKSAAMINRDALAWLAAHQERPFFLFLNYLDAHSPYEPPPGAAQRFGPARQTAGQAQSARDAYDNCLAYLDEQLGQLFDAVDRLGLLANTLVIITSDHGEGFGEHQLKGHGTSLYETELHVPLLVVFPGHVPANRAVPRPVSVRAVPATVADLAGLKRASPFPAGTLVPLWSDGGNAADAPVEPFLAEVDRAAYLQTDFPDVPAAKGQMSAVFDKRYAYIRNGGGVEEVYDLRDDPSELHDLAAVPEMQPVRAQLQRLWQRLAKNVDQGARSVTPAR